MNESALLQALGNSGWFRNLTNTAEAIPLELDSSSRTFLENRNSFVLESTQELWDDFAQD